MDGTITAADNVTFEQVLTLAERLQPVDQVRLIARLAPKVERTLDQVTSNSTLGIRKPLRGLLAELGLAPSAEDIDDVQREMWATFAQE